MGTDITYRAIGLIHTPFKKIEGMPIQPTGARERVGWLERAKGKVQDRESDGRFG